MKLLCPAILTATLLAASVALGHAQGDKGQKPISSSATIRSEIRLVEIDVVATDKKGASIADLQAKNFRIWEDNKEQVISSFTYKTEPDAERRNLVLVFDNLHLGATEFSRAREAAIQFIQAAAGPKRQMAVVVIDDVMRIAQDFTGDIGKLTAAVNSLNLSTAYQSPAARIRETQDRSASILIQALSSLAKDFSVVHGRKTLVWFSGGFTVPDTSELTAMLNALNRSNTAVYPVDLLASLPRSSDAPAGAGGLGMDASSGQRGGTQATRQPRGGLQSRDTPLVTAGSDKDIFLPIADKTGGLVIRDLVSGLGRVATEQEEIYVLTYTPPPASEGTCHALKVKVDRPGVSLRARDQYCNARPADLLAGSPIEKELEDLALGAKPGNLTGELQLPFFYNTSTSTVRVNAAIEIPLAKVKFEKRKGKLHSELQILGSAYAADGSVSARFSDTINLDFDDQSSADRSTDKPYHYENQFDIAPGQYNFEVVFRAGRDSFGTLKTPLIIDPLQPGQFGMSSLALSAQFKPAAKSDVAAALLFGDERHMVSNGVQVIPSGSSRFVKSQLVAFYCEIYEPLLVTPDPKSTTAIAVELSIFDSKTGDRKSDTGRLQVELPKDAGTPIVSLAMKIPADDLAAGSYRVEVTATDNAGKAAKRSVNLDIQ